MGKLMHFPLALFSVLLLTSFVSAQKSLVIGIDGMGFGDFGFSVADTPHMDSLIDGTWATGYSGAYSDQAFAGGDPALPETIQVTSSGPGWSTILTGVWKDKHGVTNNGFGGKNFDTTTPSYLETLEINVADIYSASLINWTPIDTHVIASVDNPTPQMDFRLPSGNDATVASATSAQIAGLDTTNPAAVFIHFDEVDGAGHGSGSGSPNFAAEIEEKDDLVGDILSTIKSRPNFANEDWQIVLTADHGHTSGGGHGGQSSLERTIPFIVSSKGLNQGGLPQGVSHADVAPTVLDHFGVTIPDYYYGTTRAIGAFIGDLDINGDGSVSGDGTGTFGDDDVVAFKSFWLQHNTLQNPNPADLNGDGIADIQDWSILNEADPSMGEALLAVLGARNTVPEPTAASLSALAIVLLLAKYRPLGSRQTTARAASFTVCADSADFSLN